MDSTEKILCAAVYYKVPIEFDSQPTNIDKGFVIMGHRHHNCINTAVALLGSLALPSQTKKVQGFLTNLNRFVDRKEGYKIALKAKQTKPNNVKTLFSEDLY